MQSFYVMLFCRHADLARWQALPLSSEVKFISSSAVSALAEDVQYLTNFVDSLDNGEMLKENLDELQQTVNLLQSENHEEFYDMSVRNKKYNRVDALNGPILLEKYASSMSIYIITQQTNDIQTQQQCSPDIDQKCTPIQSIF